MDEVLSAWFALERARQHLDRAVTDARAQGRTWNDIGEVLGMSKQAAFKRFGKPTDPTTGAPLGTRDAAGVIAITEQAFRCIASGDYDQLTGMMNPRTAKQLPPATIATVWRSVLADVGALEGFTDSHVELPGGDRIEDDERVLGTVVGVTTLQCEAGDMHGRVAVADDSKVVGILIVPRNTGHLPF